MLCKPEEEEEKEEEGGRVIIAMAVHGMTWRQKEGSCNSSMYIFIIIMEGRRYDMSRIWQRISILCQAIFYICNIFYM